MVGIIYILTPSSSSHLLNSMCCECVQVHINKAKRDRETHAGVSFLYVCIYTLHVRRGGNAESVSTISTG
jgi:hypothetical protein